jgi:hypothetical protein
LRTKRQTSIQDFFIFSKIKTGLSSLTLGALLCAASFGASQNAHAAPIFVDNFSFESPALADDGLDTFIPGWVAERDNAFNSSVFNPLGRDYNGADGQGTPANGTGPQSALFFDDGSIQSASSLATVQAGDTFTLTFAAGDPFDNQVGDLRYGFLLNDAFVTGSTTTFSGAEAFIPDGQFRDFNSFTYTATAADAGKTLKIFFGQSGTSTSVGLDNVRLDARFAVREPSTIVSTRSDNSTNTDGLISLREAIAAANANADQSTITFDPTVFGAAQTVANRTITVTTALPTITQPVSITGTDGGVIVSASEKTFSIFTVVEGGSAIFNRLTISNGSNGIRNNNGAITVSNCLLTGHTTGIFTSFGAPVTVSNSTFVSNGSGIDNQSTLTLIHCTLSSNGQAVSNLSTVTLRNCLLADNGSGISGGGVTTDGVSLLSATADSAGLDSALRSNGGPTQTLAIINAGGRAVNAGINESASNAGLTTDQRETGFARIVGTTVDLGAYESPFLPPSVLSINRADANPIPNQSSVRFTVRFSESVTGVDSSDFAIVTTGVISGASITSITGSGTTYTVTVGGISGTSGTLGLNLVDNDSIIKRATKVLAA